MSSPTSDVIQNSQFKSQFIRAGAGAGKTTKLIGTFIDFVKAFKQQNQRYPRVVMTTFTRKATQEVKERLLVSALKAGEKELFEYINKKSFVHISTIHGLLSIYLSQYAERMKFPQEIKIVDAVQYQRSLKRLINDLLKRKPVYSELMEQHSFLQLVALAADALDFKAQNKNFNFVSAEELRQIAQAKKQDIINSVEKVFSMITGIPDNWLEYFEYLKNASKLLQQGEENKFLEFIDAAPAKPRWSNSKPPFDPVAHELIQEIKDKKFKDLFDTEEFISKHQILNELFFQFINEIYELSISHKRGSGELTISDLENLSLQLLEEHPDTARDFSETWDYFMIDEYQDTSPLQVRILNQIIQNKPCFIVGDPQQSIYLFRGARSEVFEQKHSEMQQKNANILFLDTNFRSEPSLMRFINDYFAHFSTQFKSMNLKEQNKSQKSLQHDAFYIKTKNQTDAVLSHIHSLMSRGINPQEICVLSRSNKKLIDIAVKANKLSIPVQLQAASGFEEKREIIDLMCFNRFLFNPHDDENLVTLIRSPWCYVGDEQILELSQSAEAQKKSLWVALLKSNFSNKNSLIKYLNIFESSGALQATKQFIADTAFVSFSEYYDKTGKREANIFKFLTSLAQAEKTVGFSLGLFLDEQFQSLQSDLGSSDSEAQPVLQPNCVSLMTVHASKGLQFKHVIVIGFSDNPTLSQTPKISFDDVSQRFSLSVLNDHTSKHEASGWADLIKNKFNERELLENERVLYVAMTRAIESLSLVAEIGKRTPSEKSWYRKSNWPLTDGETVLNGYQILSLNSEEAPSVKSADREKQIDVRKKFSEKEQAGLQSDSVTDLISQSSLAPGQINYQAALVNLKKAQKGSDLHRIFESLKYLKPEQLLKTLDDSDQKNIIYLFEQKELNLKEILERGHNEWGFGLRTKTKFIQGQIDLWAELEDEVHILDYKTGSSDYSDKAFEQLAFYTMALYYMKMISKNKKLIHSVIYPLEKTIKKKTYADRDDFQKNLNLKNKEQFQDLLEGL